MNAAPVLSRTARRRLLIAAAAGAAGYAAYRAWKEDERLRKALHSTVAELQRCGEAALTRTTACVVAGTVQGIAAVRPQAVDVPAPTEPWQAMALEKLLGLLTTRAGMDLVSLAVAVGAQHTVAAVCQQWSGYQAAPHADGPWRQQPVHTSGSTNDREDSKPHASSRTNGRSRRTNGHSPGRSGGAAMAGPLPAGNAIVAQVLEWAATPQGERFVVAAMAAAAQNSTRACMDSLGNGNTFDDLFSAAFRPEHREVLRDLTAMATREAVGTYLCPPPQHRADSASTVVRFLRPASSGGDGGVPWSVALRHASQAAVSLMKQVSSSKAAVFGVSAVALASGRGLVLGCKDAIVRSRAADSTAHMSGQVVGFLAWPTCLVTALVCFVASMLIMGIRNLAAHGSLIAWHA